MGNPRKFIVKIHQNNGGPSYTAIPREHFEPKNWDNLIEVREIVPGTVTLSREEFKSACARAMQRPGRDFCKDIEDELFEAVVISTENAR